MTKLPSVLAEEFCCDHVEEIPRDVRISNWDAITRIMKEPEKFPNADWEALLKKNAAILTVITAWMA